VATAAAGQRPARIAVHLRGRGPLAVMIHGFPLDHRLWLDVLHGELAERRTLCAIDLRGHGHSPWAGDAVHTMERFADDVAAVIRALGDEPADVCGLSMGGYVAFALHERHRERVRSLVLTNTKASADSAAQRSGRVQMAETAAERGGRAVADAMLPKLLAAGSDPLHRATTRAMIEAQSPAAIVADLRGLAQRKDRRGELATCARPTMVIAGERDPISPPGEMQAIADAIPNARFEVIAGTAHLSPLENAAAWSSAVAKLWT
ncbi:MAG TPA: alpha/beta fold hydrolase, partial [bacterium]|nr:alpha/beta fold hydrolase [bacterium]